MRTRRIFWCAWSANIPTEVTIYAGGPMTNLALAISIDPEFATSGEGTGLHGRES